jgi:hypothetical protein
MPIRTNEPILTTNPPLWFELVEAVLQHRSAQWSGVNMQEIDRTFRKAHAVIGRLLERDGESIRVAESGFANDRFWIILGYPMLMPPDEVASLVGTDLDELFGFSRSLEPEGGATEWDKGICSLCQGNRDPLEPEDDDAEQDWASRLACLEEDQL